jgi:hypothetical protein
MSCQVSIKRLVVLGKKFTPEMPADIVVKHSTTNEPSFNEKRYENVEMNTDIKTERKLKWHRPSL